MKLPKKPEARDIQGICVLCNKNKQTSTGHGIYKPICNTCSKKRYNLPMRGGVKAKERHVYVAHKKDYCEKCDFKVAHPCQLDVHHIDGNRKNSTSTNLITLCANCHRYEHRPDN